MSQTPLFVALHLIGVCVSLGFGPRTRPWLCCALGLPIGLAVMVGLVLPLLIAGVPFELWSVGTVAAVVVAGSLLRAGRLPAAVWKRVGLWTLGFTAVCLPLTAINVSLLYADGHDLVMLGKAIAQDRGFAPGVLEQLSLLGVFQVLAHAGVAFTDETYLYSLPTVFGLTAIPLFAITLWHGHAALGIRRPRIVALVTASMFTIYMVQLHFYYLHTNMGAAVYLFTFVTLFWLAELDGDAGALPVAFVGLAAFSLSRVETPIAAALFLVPTVLLTRLPRRGVLVPLAAHTALTSGWYLVLAPRMAADSQFLSPMRCYLAAGLGLVMLGYASFALSFRAGWPARLHRAAPVIVLTVCALGLIAAFVLRPTHMAESARAYLSNLGYSRFWLGCWWAILVLAIAGLWLPAPPWRQVFVVGIPIYLLLILLLAYGRIPYRISPNDSASRMSLHLVPLAFFYFGIKFAPPAAR